MGTNFKKDPNASYDNMSACIESLKEPEHKRFGCHKVPFTGKSEDFGNCLQVLESLKGDSCQAVSKEFKALPKTLQSGWSGAPVLRFDPCDKQKYQCFFKDNNDLLNFGLKCRDFPSIDRYSTGSNDAPLMLQHVGAGAIACMREEKNEKCIAALGADPSKACVDAKVYFDQQHDVRNKNNYNAVSAANHGRLDLYTAEKFKHGFDQARKVCPCREVWAVKTKAACENAPFWVFDQQGFFDKEFNESEYSWHRYNMANECVHFTNSSGKLTTTVVFALSAVIFFSK